MCCRMVHCCASVKTTVHTMYQMTIAWTCIAKTRSFLHWFVPNRIQCRCRGPKRICMPRVSNLSVLFIPELGHSIMTLFFFFLCHHTLNGVGLLVSVPCLFVTTFFYIHINELRNLHGKSLACHSLCLAIAFLLIGVAQIRGRVPQSVGYVIQYFMLACFCWVAVMCADICIHVW